MTQLYDSVQSILNNISDRDLFLQKVDAVVKANIRAILPSRSNIELQTSYTEDHVENIVWILSLMTTSWLTINLRSKVLNGHCHNITHEHREQEPRLCSKGSQFHREFYDEIVKSLDDLLALAKLKNPIPIK
jgi:hypothetical protein